MTEKSFVETYSYYRHIHNDLEATARFLRDLSKERIESGDQAGIAHLWRSALIVSAFEFEAKVNCVGVIKLGEGWPEKAATKSKVALLGKLYSSATDYGQPPLQTLGRLFNLRNLLAHGKPEIAEKKTRLIDDDPDLFGDLRSEWQDKITAEFVEAVARDIEAFWDDLLVKANVSHFETTTRSHGSTG
ncbi:hypothetical protein J7443_07285 [Tropicibacter sp. R15_0]|uniref:hypothetical protein n=1 Tax=Tropicibacter sp. R15_0 TaxID=2821101 RepID=UPI001ADD127B|nr:hypothetical protein [Tropicibacter sp. R15_0]MBO9465026.1 hypothetical protein [Tropicibacter sp. R15_0]